MLDFGKVYKLLIKIILMTSSIDDKKLSNFFIRWMIRRDMPEVFGIENASFEFPWLEEDFLQNLRQRNCIGMIGESSGQVAGFMIYQLHNSGIHLLNFAVSPQYRRKRVGTQMLDKLKLKLSDQKRKNICLEVRETNLPAQLFFRENYFRAFSVLKDHYSDIPEDAYLMTYRHKPILQEPLEESLKSRYFSKLKNLLRVA
jgi:ribosomal-protein-alanine N-acetyltransferase